MAFQWVLLLLRASGILPCSKLVVLATLYKCFQNKSLVPRLFASRRSWRTIPTEGLLRDYSKMEPYEGLFQIEASFGDIPECGLIWDYSRMGPYEHSPPLIIGSKGGQWVMAAPILNRRRRLLI